MSLQTCDKLQQVKPSPTFAIASRAAQMRAEGKQVIALSVGEPDFGTPEHIQQAAIDAIHAGQTRYTPVEGLPLLRESIIAKLSRENNLEYAPNQIVASCGAKQSLYNAFQAIMNPGDEAIIPAPYWVSYPPMALLAGGVPVIINTDIKQQFKIQPEQLEAAITNRTRIFVLNSPSNPSGMAYSESELKALAEVLVKYPDIVILSDDIYEHIMWEGKTFLNIVNVCPELKERTIVINGMSKAFCMTGWRLGYAAGPEKLMAACKKIQSQSTSNPCSIAQHAAMAGLKGGMDFIKPMIRAFKSRHDLVVSGLNQIEGVSCLEADGTFYAFPDVSQAIQRLGLDDDVALAELLLVEGLVATVPGSAFGMPGYIRMSYALDEATLTKALDSIATLMNVTA